MKSIISLFLASILALANCDAPLKEFANGNLKFTARLYNEIVKEKPNQNFIFSPFSIEVILALTRAGAKGLSREQLTTALNLPSEEVTEAALKQFLPVLRQSSEHLQLSTANKMYVAKNLRILDSFQNTAVNSFGAGIENVDFSQKDQAVKLINQWVEDQTNNKIKNLVSRDVIDESTRLLLINALHFKGTWLYEFSKKVLKEKFYTSKTQSKQVDMMSVEETFRYYESPTLNAKFLELPYVGGNISMTVVLPNEIEGLSALENNLEQLLTPQDLDYQRVAVKLPSFLIESEYPLKSILQRLGLTSIFEDAADFSGISETPLKVSQVVQKAFINVTTSGTEAAAATYGK